MLKKERTKNIQWKLTKNKSFMQKKVMKKVNVVDDL